MSIRGVNGLWRRESTLGHLDTIRTEDASEWISWLRQQTVIGLRAHDCQRTFTIKFETLWCPRQWTNKMSMISIAKLCPIIETLLSSADRLLQPQEGQPISFWLWFPLHQHDSRGPFLANFYLSKIILKQQDIRKTLFQTQISHLGIDSPEAHD